jgi:hypothetical protein
VFLETTPYIILNTKPNTKKTRINLFETSLDLISEIVAIIRKIKVKTIKAK